MTQTTEIKNLRHQTNLIITGLVKAGAVPCHYRQNIPVTRKGEFHFLVNGVKCTFFLCCYSSDANTWRIVYEGNFQPTPRGELSYHASEISENMGEELYNLLYSKTIKLIYQWSLFSNYSSYPHYAWSAKGAEEQKIVDNNYKLKLEKRIAAEKKGLIYVG